MKFDFWAVSEEGRYALHIFGELWDYDDGTPQRGVVFVDTYQRANREALAAFDRERLDEAVRPEEVADAGTH